LLQAGKCRELLGEWKEAVQLYERLLSVYPHTTFTDEAQHRLKAARLRVPNER
jgi:outer membrane protein assembly factor BamD (BamD/ComL family)